MATKAAEMYATDDLMMNRDQPGSPRSATSKCELVRRDSGNWSGDRNSASSSSSTSLENPYQYFVGKIQNRYVLITIVYDATHTHTTFKYHYLNRFCLFIVSGLETALLADLHEALTNQKITVQQINST